MTESAKTAEYADEVAPARVETLMAGHAARRWILEARLNRRVDEVFLARLWKKEARVARAWSWRHSGRTASQLLLFAHSVALPRGNLLFKSLLVWDTAKLNNRASKPRWESIW